MKLLSTTNTNPINKIKKYTLPKIIKWLNRYNIPYDDIIVGKVWCDEGFYVDDKAMTLDHFEKWNYNE